MCSKVLLNFSALLVLYASPYSVKTYLKNFTSDSVLIGKLGTLIVPAHGQTVDAGCLTCAFKCGTEEPQISCLIQSVTSKNMQL
jgi:hypothetical protein